MIPRAPVTYPLPIGPSAADSVASGERGPNKAGRPHESTVPGDEPSVRRLGGVIATQRHMMSNQAPDTLAAETRAPKHRVYFTRRPWHNGQATMNTGRVLYIERTTTTPTGKQEPLGVFPGRLTNRDGAPGPWALNGRVVQGDRA